MFPLSPIKKGKIMRRMDVFLCSGGESRSAIRDPSQKILLLLIIP